jgi:hypothetical protein
LVSIVFVGIGENIMKKHSYMSKISKHNSKGIRDNSYQNLTFLKLMSGYQPNNITIYINSEVELFYGEIGETELSLIK